MSNPKFKAILFDLDGTLHLQTPRGGEVFTEYVQSLGYKISDEDKTRAEHWTHFYFAGSLEIKNDGQAYQDEKSFWLNFARRRLVALGISPVAAVELAPKVSAHMAENHKPTSFVPQEAFALLDSLKSSGYILGMVSNRDKPFGDKLKELRLDAYFDFTLASVEVNSHKPDPVIFERALELAGTSAQEAMYVGDNYFADVIGARRVNITPVLYDPTSLFSDVGCEVIRSFRELEGLLK